MNSPTSTSRTALVIDDEMSGRTMVTFYINELMKDIFSRVISVSDLEEAKKTLQLENIFMVFTDIELQDEMGLELSHFIPKHIPLVVVSAHSQYAIQAIQIDVFDYLLKPLGETEVLRLKRKIKEKLKLELTAHSEEEDERIVLKDSGENIIIPISDITYLEACGAYSKIHTEARSFIASKTLKSIEEILPVSFLRVHRSFIVPLERISSYTTNTVCLKDGKNISLSKSGKKLLQAYI